MASLEQRLLSRSSPSKQILLDAFHGTKLPYALGHELTRLCVIHGIRHNDHFARNEASILRGCSSYPAFTRALNARSIMSNHIPDRMDSPEEVPYCIWYPSLPSSETCRTLLDRFPSMVYQIARVCAIAGYTELFLELDRDILPEVNIAEEARNSGNTTIFEWIMAKPVRYKVMDDYFRSITPDKAEPSSLDGDTAVRSTLQETQKWRVPAGDDNDDNDSLDTISDRGFEESVFDITEDQNISETEIKIRQDPMLHLLYSPLPNDLPAGNKDTLILMAAYYGNIDRYTRLRRPMMIKKESICIIRGIYHNSLFAKWWEGQEQRPVGEPYHVKSWDAIQSAITARQIMNNDVSRALLCGRSSLPYLIWYPDIAEPATYKALSERVPEMRTSCLRAAIFADFAQLFDQLLVDTSPDAYLVAEAEQSPNPKYLEALKAKARETGVNLGILAAVKKGGDGWKMSSVRKAEVLVRGNSVGPEEIIGTDSIGAEWWEQAAIYNGARCSPDMLELFLSLPEGWKPTEKPIELDYVEWPST
ncbi:hypothetical protein BJ165DRAFT_1468064 [Panaeolus papilionaceus]|nr:hypothetical protein BJ165DRAFT_1468064 [Panaeolus papilionaceus]